MAFKGWTFKSPKSNRPTPPYFPEFTNEKSTAHGHDHDHEVDQLELRGDMMDRVDGRVYGHGLEQDLEQLNQREESGDTITPGTYRDRGTVRSRALSF